MSPVVSLAFTHVVRTSCSPSFETPNELIALHSACHTQLPMAITPGRGVTQPSLEIHACSPSRVSRNLQGPDDSSRFLPGPETAIFGG